MRSVYSDQLVSEFAADISADATLDNEEAGASFDVAECYSPVVVLNVSSLVADGKLAFKLQHKDTADSSWTDVPAGVQTDADPSVEVEANGVRQYGYAGQKDQIRVVVISKTASPGASVSVVYQRHRLWEKPNNRSF